jgi:hypothetical protein
MWAAWSKNREKIALATQSSAKIDPAWGIASQGHDATPELQGSCAQRNRLKIKTIPLLFIPEVGQ